MAIGPTISGVNVAVGLESASFMREIAQITRATQRAAANIDQSLGKMHASFTKTGKAVTAFAGSFSGLFAIGQIKSAAMALADYSDQWERAKNKVAASASISGMTAASMDQIVQMARITRQPLEDIVDLYSKLLRVSKDVGLSTEEVGQATVTVAKSMAASSASTLEQVNAIRQFAQSLGSGIFQGDELRSIRENAPLLAKAIAEEFKTTVAGLKQLGAQGELEAGRVARAVIKAGAAIPTAFAKTNPTIASAFTVLDNSIIQYIGHINDANRVNSTFASGVLSVADNLSVLANAFDKVTAASDVFNLFGNIIGLTVDLTVAINNLVKVDANTWFGYVVNGARMAVNAITPLVLGIKGLNAALDYLRGKAAATGPDYTPEGAITPSAPTTSPLDSMRGKGTLGSAGEAQKFSEAIQSGMARATASIDAGADSLTRYAQAATTMTDASEGVAKGSDKVAGAAVQATAHVDAYKASITKNMEAEAALAGNKYLQEHSNQVVQAYQNLPTLIDATTPPLQQYANALEQIRILEERGALSAQQSFQARAITNMTFANQVLGAAGAVSGALTQMFKENKAIAIANAVINTAEAITSALKNPPGPPFSYVYAAAAAIAGAAQIATIVSAQPGNAKSPSVKGGGGGKKIKAVESAGASSTSSSGSKGKDVFKQNVTLILEGDSFGPEHFKKMVQGLNAVIADGAQLRVGSR